MQSRIFIRLYFFNEIEIFFFKNKLVDAMKLQLVKYKCAQCKSEFKVPHLRSGAYGEFLLRSTSGEVAYLDAMKDSTYDEVFDLIKSHRKIAHQSPNKLAEILRRSYGHIACDKDNQGEYFAIGTSPICPVCKSQDMEYWEVLEPPEFINDKIDPVTHNDWNNLSTLQKENKVEEILSSLNAFGDHSSVNI